MRLPGQTPRFAARFFQSDDRGISRFLRRDVFARALAELLRGLGDVENVVDDLEGEAERAAEAGHGRNCFAFAFAAIAPSRIEVVSSAAVLFS